MIMQNQNPSLGGHLSEDISTNQNELTFEQEMSQFLESGGSVFEQRPDPLDNLEFDVPESFLASLDEKGVAPQGQHKSEPQATQEHQTHVDKQPLGVKFLELRKHEMEIERLRRENEALMSEKRKNGIEPSEQEKNFSVHELKRLARENPKEFAELSGMNLDDYMNYVGGFWANDNQHKPETKLQLLQERLERTEQELREKQERFVLQQEQQQINNALKAYEGHVAQIINNEDSKFPLVRAIGASSEVVELVKEYYLQSHANGSPVLLSIEDAASMVEAELEKRYEPILKMGQKQQTNSLSSERNGNPIGNVLPLTQAHEQQSIGKRVGNEDFDREDLLKDLDSFLKSGGSIF